MIIFCDRFMGQYVSHNPGLPKQNKKRYIKTEICLFLDLIDLFIFRFELI